MLPLYFADLPVIEFFWTRKPSPLYDVLNVQVKLIVPFYVMRSQDRAGTWAEVQDTTPELAGGWAKNNRKEI